MRSNRLKRLIVLMLAVAMLITGSGFTTAAESAGEGSDNAIVEEHAVDPGQQEEAQAEDADAASKDATAEEPEKEEAKAEPEKEEAKDSKPETKDTKDTKEDKKTDSVKAETKADWEATLPDKLPKDIREAAVKVAKSQLDAAGSRYIAFAKADSKDWDASFALFVLNYSDILKASKSDSIHFDKDTTKWVKALEKAEMLKKIAEATDDAEAVMPEKGDIVFIGKDSGNGDAEAGIVLSVDNSSLTIIGADRSNNNIVGKFDVNLGGVLGFVSLKDIAPSKFDAEEPAGEDAEAAEEAAEDGKEDAEEADAEEAAEKAAKEAAKARAEAAEKAAEKAAKAAEAEAVQNGLTKQTVEAELVSAPGVGGKLKGIGRALSGADRNTEITLVGMMPEGAYVKAYPVSIEVPGQNVLAAYDITIYVKDEEGNEVEWQPEVPVNVSIKTAKLAKAAENADNDASFNVFHMESADANAIKIDSVDLGSGEAVFEAESFSIYAVTEEQPAVRVHYRFWMSKDEATAASGTPYRSFSLTNNEQLKAPADPTDASKGQFTGWKYKDGDGAVTFPITASVSGSTDTYIDIYAEFDGEQYATFMSLPTGTRRTVYHTAALTKESNGTYSVDLSGVPEYGAPVGYKFVGWTAKRPTDAKGYGDNTAKADYHKDAITGLDGSVELYPVCKKVYNVSFNGNGGKVQNLPVYKVLVTNDDVWSDVLAKVSSVERSGYSKNNGWFDGPGSDASAVTLSGDVALTADMTYYAHWNPGTTTVTVKYWKEPVDRTPSHHVPYELIDSETITVPTETVLNLSASSMSIGSCTLAAETVRGNIVTGGSKINGGNFTADPEMNYFYVDALTVFDANGDYHATDGTAGSDMSVPVAEDGSTIIDVWYNRTVYQLKFTLEIHATGTDAEVNDRLGLIHDISKRFPSSGYYNIRLGEDLSSIWPSHTADENNVKITSSTGWRITSMGKRNTSYNSYPNAVNIGFSFPLSEVNEQLLSEANGNKIIDLWARYERKATGGLTASTVNEYYEQFGSTEYRLKASNLYRKTSGSDAVAAQVARSYTGYELDLTKTAQNNSAGFNTETRAATFNSNNTVNFYYNLLSYKVRLNWGDIELVSGNDIKYTQPIQSYLEGNSSTSTIFADPTAAARAKGMPDYMEFGGWYTDADCNEAYKLTNTTIMPATNVVLYAKFTPKKVTVNIDNNKEGEADQTVTDPALNMSGSEFGNSVRELDYTVDGAYEAHAHTIAEFLPTYWTTPVWENHVFKGWQISYDGGTSWEDIADFNTFVDDDIMLRAQWQDMSQHSIHYIEEGKEVYHDSNKYVEGCSVVVKGTDTEIYDKTTETSKVFRYWLASDGTTQYHPGDTIVMGKSDITLTAVFEEGGSSSGGNKATYTFVVPDGSGWTTYYEEIVYKGERLSPPPTNPTDGAPFQGWYVDEACKVKFEGFGTVNAPVNTTLYASFKTPYRVTYYGHEGELITVQNYSGDGTDYLDTSGVGENYSYSSEYAVIGWATTNETPGTVPATYYNGLTERQVTSDLTMYPVLEGGYYLYFVTAEDAVQIPAKFYAKSQNLNFTWPDPDEVTRENYTFTGKWYTDAACTNEFNWNRTLSGPTTIYAGWKLNEGVEVKSTYTVAWWVEKADSNGDRDDISNYYYSNSVVSDEVTVGTQIGRTTSVAANGDTGAASNVAHVENIASDKRTYFEYHMAKVSYTSGLEGSDVVNLSGTQTAPVDKSGKTTLNIFVSRKRYTVNFVLNNRGKITYGNATTPSNSTWTLPGQAWLEMPWAGKWPTFEGNGDTTPKLEMINNYGYGSWSAAAGSGIKTTPVILEADNIPTNGNVTFTLGSANKANSTYHAYYRFRDDENSAYTAADYNGKTYDQTFDTAVNLNHKGFAGYTFDTEEKTGTSQDSGYTYTDFTFYYTRNKQNLILRDSRHSGTNVETISVMTGELLEGKVNESDPCAAYGLTAPTGMEFDAWSRSSASVVPISFTNTSETMPDNQMIIYAHWRTQTVVVTYVDDEGDVLSQTRRDIYTKFKDFDINPIDKPGYAFVGWEYTEDPQTGGWHSISNNKQVSDDITVRAKYRSLTSKPVYYDLNGGTVTGGTSPLDNTTLVGSRYKDNDVYVIGATVPVKQLDTNAVTKPAGSVSFVYWSSEADGTGKLYYPNDVIELPEDEDTVLYAIWAPNMTTTLVYNLNYTGKPDDKSVLLNDYRQLQENALKVNDNYEVGTEYNETSKAYEKFLYTVDGKTLTTSGARPGYTLLGWDESSAADIDPAYKDGDLIRATSYKADDGSYLEKQTLYAHWDRDVFDVEAYEIVKGVENTEPTADYTGEFGLPNGTSVPAVYNCGANDSSRLDTAYLTEISKTLPTGTAYAYAKIGGVKVQKVQYVEVKDEDNNITGYKWQYTTNGTSWNDFVTSGTNKTTVKLYYYQETIEVPIKYLIKGADGTLAEISSTDWNVPTGDANTKASVGTTATSYGKTSTDTKTFAEEMSSATEGSLNKLHYVGTAIGAATGTPALETGVSPADDYFLQNSTEGVKHADSSDGLNATDVAKKTGDFAIYVVYEEQPAYLEIQNTCVETYKDYTFRLTLAGGSYTDTLRSNSGNITVASGQTYYDIDIAHQGSRTIYIPYGSGLTYQVQLVKNGTVVADLNDESVKWSDAGNSGTLVTGPLLTASANVTLPTDETKYKSVVLQDKGKLGLTVTNTITGEYADMTGTFDVTVTLTKANTSSTISSDEIPQVTAPEGSALTLAADGKSVTLTASLGNNEAITIPAIPDGWKYTISETAVDGYTTTYKTGDGSFVETAPSAVELSGNDASVTIKNEFKDDTIVPSGIEHSNSILIPLFVVMILALGTVLSIRRRRRVGVIK